MRQHYRLYTILKIPSLQVLDFTKIKASERERAKRLASSAAGAALESDVQVEARQQQQQSSTSSTSLTFVPGAGNTAQESFGIFTPEQKAQIREMVANAKSSAEMDRIEQAVTRGEFPTWAMASLPPPPPPPPPPALVDESSKKRSLEKDANGNEAKKVKS